MESPNVKTALLAYEALFNVSHSCGMPTEVRGRVEEALAKLGEDNPLFVRFFKGEDLSDHEFAEVIEAYLPEGWACTTSTDPDVLTFRHFVGFECVFRVDITLKTTRTEHQTLLNAYFPFKKAMEAYDRYASTSTSLMQKRLS